MQKNIDMFTREVIRELDVNIESCTTVIGFHEIESEACVEGGTVYVYSEMEVEGFLNGIADECYFQDTVVTSLEIIEGLFVSDEDGSERQLNQKEIEFLNKKLA